MAWMLLQPRRGPVPYAPVPAAGSVNRSSTGDNDTVPQTNHNDKPPHRKEETVSHSPAQYLPGLMVKYAGATNTKGSRWIATLTRGIGAENRYRASVPYADGPDAAAAAVVARFNEANGITWRIDPTALSLDGTTTFAYGCFVNY